MCLHLFHHMKNYLASLLLFCSTLLSAQSQCEKTFNFSLDTSAEVGPYNHLNINNDPCNFQFAIVTDRTGGHRQGVFMDGVNKLNLLQPEFVMSVGDLIEGYTMDTTELRRQWDEFESFVNQLQMPFFYLPGNHDITNEIMERVWEQRFGATYYHFVYKDVLFLCLNSEDRRRGAGRGTISDEQYEYITEVLESNEDVRWTLLFMHQPLWHQQNTERWQEVERLLQDRKHTVYAGHEHRYVKETRNKGKYITLATTGGGSKLRGPTLGEFDHVMWVTMTDEGPIMANLMLQGIWDEDVVTSETKEIIERMAIHPPIEIEPVIKRQENSSREVMKVTIINDENLPMEVEFKFENSEDLVLQTDSTLVTVPPNSRRQFPLEMWTPEGNAEHPAVITMTLSLKPEGENAIIKYPYSYRVKPLDFYQLRKTKKRKQIDGNLSDWDDLSYRFIADEGSAEVWFDVRYDDEFLYMAARVKDDSIYSLGKGAAFRQDNIALGFNAEKSSRSAMSVGRDWYRYEFLQLITPSYDTVPSVTYREMPKGSMIKCVRTKTGYQAELAVPISYIEEKQGKDWQSIRINVGIDNTEDGREVRRSSWQPSWRSDDNILGSGLFWR
jgi:hypothetical protein